MGATTTSDVLPALDAWTQQAAPLRQAADQLRRLALEWPDAERRERLDESELRRALLSGYPDRVARRREAGSPRLLLATGAGAELARDSGVRDAEWLVALDVAGAVDRRRRPGVCRQRDRPGVAGTDADHGRAHADRRRARLWNPRDVVRRTAPLRGAHRHRSPQPRRRCWRKPTSRGRATSRLRSCCGGFVSSAPRSTCQTWPRRRQPARARWTTSTSRSHLSWDLQTRLDREAPERLEVPSGRTAALDYRDDGSVAASVKLQELFGLAETPRIGPRAEPVLLLLLAPNGRPVQTTRDLRSFWERTYPEVRKELRGRYPRHPWPDDPWTATPTARTKRRDRR